VPRSQKGATAVPIVGRDGESHGPGFSTAPYLQISIPTVAER
jgi:hypothetical protein